MYVGIGVNDDSFVNDPVTGTVNADYKQAITQTADCVNDSTCFNNAIIEYFATAKDDAVVNSKSDQSITQSSKCNDQTCNNVGYLINSIYAEDDAKVTANTKQSLTQSCTTASGPTCTNTNNIALFAEASDSANLKYTSSQKLSSTNGNNDGENQNINIVANTPGNHNLGTISQTQPNQVYTYPP